jgi:hypothetical protein
MHDALGSSPVDFVILVFNSGLTWKDKWDRDSAIQLHTSPGVGDGPFDFGETLWVQAPGVGDGKE